MQVDPPLHDRSASDTSVTPDLDPGACLEGAASRAGFSRQHQRLLWLRALPDVVHGIAMTVDDDAGASLESGVWLPALASILRQPDELRDLAQCHLRFASRQFDRHDIASCVVAVQDVAQELDQVGTFSDAADLIVADKGIAPRGGPHVRDVYVAALAILGGWPGTLWLAEAAATHCAGDPVWSPIAGHLYAMVATAE